MKPYSNKPIIILFSPKHFVEFSLKALMSFKVIQKYWKLKEMQFIPLGVVVVVVVFLSASALFQVFKGNSLGYRQHFACAHCVAMRFILFAFICSVAGDEVSTSQRNASRFDFSHQAAVYKACTKKCGIQAYNSSSTSTFFAIVFAA